MVYVVQHTENDYKAYRNIFNNIAIVNSIASILQFIFMNELGLDTQKASGLFGYHGTGLGAVFSAASSCVFLGRFLDSKKIKFLFLSLFVMIPIVTGYAYGGFILLISGVLITLYYAGMKISKKQIFFGLVGVVAIITTIFLVTSKLQDKNHIESYLLKFSNIDMFLNQFYLIMYVIIISMNSKENFDKIKKFKK